MHELRSRIPFSEFLEWVEYLLQEERRNTKLDWYLAQVAAEIRKSFVESPNKIKISDFLLGPLRAEAVEAGAKSKAAWAGFLRVDVKGKRN